MVEFTNAAGVALVRAMAEAIRVNAALLSDLDGAVGDGDHGINMNQGFSLCLARLDQAPDLAAALSLLGDVLLDEVGGAMGPLYGRCFTAMGTTLRGKDRIASEDFSAMLAAGLEAVKGLGGARRGDKTLVDVLEPAAEAFEAARERGFAVALDEMARAAAEGKDATRDLVARIGRASRLGERSRGFLDAGAVSCWLLLTAMADASVQLLEGSHAR